MEIDRLIEIAKAGNVPHQVAFNRRFSPLVTELKRLLSDSPVSHIDYILSRVGRDHEDFSTTAIHAIDTTRFIAGSDFHEVQIYHQENQGEHGFYLNQQLNGQLANGASFHITICPSSGIVLERATVYCNDQTFFISNNLGPDSPGQIQYYQKGHLIAEINGESFCGRRDDYYLNGFYHEDARFFDLIQAGLPAPNDFLSARQSVALMQALQEKRTVFINGCL
jgi:predicted dehydrogenase